MPPQSTDIESLTSSAYRAVSGDAKGDVKFGGGQSSLITGDKRLVKKNRKFTARLPSPKAAEPISNQPHLRGAADSTALYRRYHNEDVQARTGLNSPEGRMLFDVLEQVRCEALGAQSMKGVADNLAAALEDACVKKKYHTAADRGALIPMEDGLYALAFEGLTGQSLDVAGNATAQAWRPLLMNRFDGDAFESLRNTLDNQEKFAQLSEKFIYTWMGLNSPQTSEGGESSDDYQDQTDSGDPQYEDASAQPQAQGDQGDEGGQSQDVQNTSLETMEGESPDNDLSQMTGQDAMGDRLPDDGSDMVGGADKEMPAPYFLDDRAHSYVAFTTDFDEIVDVQKLASAEELIALRAQLDDQLKPLQTLTGKLANRLQRILLARQQRQWRFDLDEGTLNTNRLARIIADPTIPVTYKQEIETDFQDTVLTLLIDNSGSMRGRPITVAALTADILTRTLERCGVKVEVLGFTTVNWKGGQSRRKWTESGRPANPGRLNDIRHIIYKAADAPLRRNRNNLALMLKEGILKENIDGEALVWAYQRLKSRKENRRILMVISDGAPVDDSTLSANEAGYLERDLHHVIKGIENQSDIELTAIGIGHDVSKYYKQAVTIRDVAELPTVMMNELASLFQK
jgi:cobaltochelatase CobT